MFLFSVNSYSQDTINLKLPDTVLHWKIKNSIGFDINEVAFSNWNTGGVSSISGIIKGDFLRIYKTKNVKWVNEFITRYGINKQDGLRVQKTEDAIIYNTSIGYRKNPTSNWYHSAKFNFNTQFSDGYTYPNTDLAISGPFAPAYTFLGVGAEYYNKEEKVNFYISPLTMKNTLVLKQRLADQGAFGVVKATYDLEGNMLTRGEKSKTEFGFLITSIYKKEILKNVNFENRLSLYSDYINEFGNIDVDWLLQLDLVVNKYVRTNIGAQIVYDDNIKSKKTVNGEQVTGGPKIQLRQVLGVGLVYLF